MSRRGGFASVVRAAARIEREHHAARRRAAREFDRDQRELARQTKADARDAARQYAADRFEEAADLTRDTADRDAQIEGLLTNWLDRDRSFSFTDMLRTFAADDMHPPVPADYPPERMSLFLKLIPGAAKRRARLQAEADDRFRAANEKHARHLAEQLQERQGVEQHNAAVEELERGVLAHEHDAVVDFYQTIIERSLEGEADATAASVGYMPSSLHLVVDLELPPLDAVPEETSFKYVKSADRIDPVARPMPKRRALYGHLISQTVLKCADAVFRSPSYKRSVDTLTINGMLDAIDPATGQVVRPCLLSVRLTVDDYGKLNLRQVQPETCLKSLRASVSRSPAELVPVKPFIELNMVDPRFIESSDVLGGIDSRTNLMDLTPGEFEGLITNLFAKMGLDTKQTRASRDGGVDCVAFDSRPIFGGKVVIQAKRYKNTVGVSAVRDLFGTVQNEGASKGILVTTSGFGKASNEFARGKPLELLDGGHLLHLLAEHAGIEAKIVIPDTWADLPIHGD